MKTSTVGITYSDLLLAKINSSVTRIVANVGLVFAATFGLFLFAQVQIPLPFTPIPITMHTFAVLMFSMALGFKRSIAFTSLYALLGLIGAPIFAGFTFGVKATLGAVLAFIVMGALVGKLSEKNWDRSYARTAIMIVAATLLCYVGITAWLMFFLNVGFVKALTLGVVPFIIGDIIKAVVATVALPTSWKLHK